MESGRSDHDPSSWQRPSSSPSRRPVGKQRKDSPPEPQLDSVSSDQQSSSHAPVSASTVPSKPSRKRRKQFKYMLTHTRSHPSLSQLQQTQHQHALEQHNARKESRKKVKKACIYCKRSHMPCEEGRPCQRCIKRGISDLCRDAEPVSGSGKPSSSASSRTSTSYGKQRQQDDYQDVEPSSSSVQAVPLRLPGASARDPDSKPMMPISHLLSPAEASYGRPVQHQRHPHSPSQQYARPASTTSQPMALPTSSRPFSPTTLAEQAAAWDRNLDLPSQQALVQMLEAGPTHSDLNDIFADKPTSLLISPSMLAQPVSNHLLRPTSESALREQNQYLHGSVLKVPAYSKQLSVKEEPGRSSEMAQSQGYSYTYGFAKLAMWMQTRYSRQSRESIDRTLAILRPRLLSISRSLPEHELVELEQSFTRLVHHYQANVLECVPVPTLVTRRTGEIYAANQHMAKLLQLPSSLLEGGQISHFQTVTESDAVELWKLHTDECLGNLRNPPSRMVTLEVDRSLLLYNTSAFDPRSGETRDDSSVVCQDGSPAVLRKRVIISFEAKISRHGLPLLIVATYTEIPDPMPEPDPSSLAN